MFETRVAFLANCVMMHSQDCIFTFLNGKEVTIDERVCLVPITAVLECV